MPRLPAASTKNIRVAPVAYLPQSRYAIMIAYGEFRVMIGYAKL